VLRHSIGESLGDVGMTRSKVEKCHDGTAEIFGVFRLL
jgi:hypothetical protein